MAPAEITSVKRKLNDVKAQVHQVEDRSRELLDLLNQTTRGEDYASKVMEVADSLQTAATSADRGLEAVESELPRQPEANSLQKRKANAMQELTDSASQAFKGLEDVASVVEIIRSTTGLTVECCAYNSHSTSLLDDPQIIQRVDPDDALEVVLEVPQVLRAHLALDAIGGHTLQAVAVYGTAERQGLKDAFGTSEFIVFRRISAVADQALTYFKQQAHQKGKSPVYVLLSMLLWLTSYRDLFEAECSILHSILAFDTASQGLIPSIFRPFALEPSELRRAALKSRAYHLHAVPKEVL